MNCPACGQELTDAGAPCPRCGHVESPWARPDDDRAGAGRRHRPRRLAGGYGDPRPVPRRAPGDEGRQLPGGRRAAEEAQPAARRAHRRPVPRAGRRRGRRRRRLPRLVRPGKRPSDVLPGSALSYGQLDLDPSLLQKTAAWQFLRDLPEVKAAVAAGLPDPKALLWKLMVKDDEYLGTVNYETDVKPWLGNRYGAAFVNHLGKPAWVAAVQLADTEVGVRTLQGVAEEGRLGQRPDLRRDVARQLRADHRDEGHRLHPR